VVWHEYDVPTAGLFSVTGTRVLFTIWGAPDERLTVWAYTCLTEPEAKQLAEVGVSSVTDLAALIGEHFAGRPAVFALADDLRIWMWHSQDVKPGAAGLGEAVVEFLRVVRESLERQKGTEAEIQVKLAGVEAAKDELISAP
jgi:hypothetical protein